jgi:hypothetical protein
VICEALYPTPEAQEALDQLLNTPLGKTPEQAPQVKAERMAKMTALMADR